MAHKKAVEAKNTLASESLSLEDEATIFWEVK